MGYVVSNRADKSISVTVERKFRHLLYGKFVRKRTKLMAHDPNNTCQIGDKVRISETRPLSKKKHWRLVAILERRH